jgi:hypothetical protein
MWRTGKRGETMRLLLTVQSIALAVYALPTLLIPKPTWSLYGVTLGPGAVVLAQFFGGVALGNALLSWLARDSGDTPLRRAVLLAFFIHWGIGFIVSFVGQLTGAMNTLGWTLVFWTLLFAALFGIFRFRRSATSEA